MRWRNGLLVIALVLAIGVGLVWFRRAEDARLRGALAEARQEIAEGRYFLALDRLTEIQRLRPAWPEVAYSIGLAEKGRGKPERADAAWRDVPIAGEFGSSAAIERSRLAMAAGRFTKAESLLMAALTEGVEPKAEARRVMILLLRFQGRNEEIRSLYLDSLNDPKTTLYQGFEALQNLWNLDRDPFPIEAVRSYLNEVAGSVSDDGRVRLGFAHLATRAGKLDEADRMITRCEAELPRDQGVARARLDWAITAERPDRARVALERIKGDQPEADALSAWLARLSGDRATEKAALKARLEAVPGDLPALERLAELAALENDPKEAARLRALKDQRDRLQTEYKTSLFAEQPVINSKEIARLGRELGIAPKSSFWNRLNGVPTDQPPPPPPLQAELGTLLRKITPARSPGQEGAPANTRERVITFDDVAEKAGLAMIFDPGRSEARQLPETMSGGVALIDYDLDGWLDVYALQGGTFPAGASETGDRLFRNKHDGTFEDVTTRAGIAALPKGYGHGASVGDIDGDGRPDLFITRWRSYLLLRNRGDGTFEDVTRRYGLDGDRDWPTSSAFADLDGDGDLDLYVCHYLAWSAEHPKICDDPAAGHAFYCTPSDFPALSDHIFRNDGGKFVDVTEEAGVHERAGRGLGVLAADLDDDGKVDLYVANDMSANYLFHNLGGMKFEEVGYEWGVATNGTGGHQAGMGIALGDLDGDLLSDLAVTNFYSESTTLHKNLGKGFFADHTAPSGLAALTRDLLGFGIAINDFDNDGFPDMLTANGHVNDGRPKYPWKMPAQLLRGRPNGKPRNASDTAGPPFQAEHLGRGLATGDLDNDGRIDAVIVAQEEPLVVLSNTTKLDGNRFATFKLVGTATIGTKITVQAKGRTWRQQQFGGGSYLSASDGRIHFGVGPVERLESVEVRWPSGKVDRYENVETNRAYRVVEGAKELEPGS